MRKFFSLLLLVPLFVSCGVTNYTISLQNVEVPKDHLAQYSDSKVVGVPFDDQAICVYEDDLIAIEWYINSDVFFTLENKSDYTIKIPWDEIAFVNELGYAMRVLKSDVFVIEKNNMQVPAIVPKYSKVSDRLIPSDYVVISPFNEDKVKVYQLFPSFRSKAQIQKSGLIGENFKIYFPLIVNGFINEYIFEFKIEDIYFRYQL